MASLAYLLLASTFVSQIVKFLIQLAQSFLVQIQVYHTTLVIHRSCSTIGHGLCHIIHVDIIAKHLLGVAIAL